VHPEPGTVVMAAQPVAFAPQYPGGQYPVMATQVPGAPLVAPSLPEGWHPATDPATGNTYYYHADSGTTSWEMPTGSPPDAGKS